jgi:CDP-diglyceride synthetase
MIWCRIPVFQALSKPIDNGKSLNDGRRIFGNNKTWKGFGGYIVFAVICTVIWGLICGSVPTLSQHNYFYVSHENTVLYNLIIGAALGLAYALFELPNSFIKRRLGIEEGKPAQGAKKWVFVFFDQADSIFGCVLVLCLVYSMTIPAYLGYVLIGAGTHIIINVLLYFAKLRNNPF